MGEKVQVRIFGQEYSVVGDKSSEQIQKISEYVDEKMHMISKVTGRNSTNGVAVLTAINVAEEYFDTLDEIEHLKNSNEQLEKDSNYYMKMWEDSKKNYMSGAKESLERVLTEAEKRGEQIEGAILKANSPSCGSGKIYDGTFTGIKVDGDGCFAAMLKELGIKVITEKEIENNDQF